jgi:tRNA-dihydrouridine synthase
MATVSHSGFRVLVEDWGGCALHFTEMIDAASHLAGGTYERWYADAAPCPDRVVYQIVGADEDDLVAAAASLAARDCAGVDLNMGCSAPRVFRHGAGIAWMADPVKAGRLAARLRRAVGGKSLSLKLRLGEEEDEEALVTLARVLEAEGADFLTLHPRVRRDSLSRPARWEWVTVVREAVDIPVVGNGDLDSFAALRGRAARTPADGWMLGRRAVAAPWTFRYWRGRWNDQAFDFEVDLEQVCHRFHELLERHQPREFWVTRSRRFYAYFSANLVFGHRWGARLQRHRDYPELVAEALAYFDEHPDERRQLASALE